MKIFKYILFIFLGIIGAKAQDSTSNFLPHSLGEGVNTAAHELNPVLSYDGKTLFFSREDSVKSKYWNERPQMIYCSKLQADNTWSKAEKLPENVNAGMYNAAVGISKSGDTLYINGRFNKKTNRWYKRGLSYVVKGKDSSWSNPIGVYVRGLPRMNKGLFSNMSISNYGEILFVSMSKRLGSHNNNIYRCEKHGDFYWKPRKLKKPIRHYKADEAPFLTADGVTLYFSTDRKDKNRDIYKTSAKDPSFLKWTDPVKVSDTINSTKWDSYLITNAKSSWAYFCSHNKAVGGSDIFRVKLFEENPFILVNGTVAVIKDGKESAPTSPIKIISNGVAIDTLQIDKDGKFKLMLPLKAKYSLKAESKNHVSSTEEIVDATDLREYKETSKKFVLRPSDALISGKLATTENKLFSPEDEPKLYVNGKELTKENAKAMGIDTFAVDFNAGTYMVEAPLQKKYTFEIHSKETKPVQSVVDLSNELDFKEINKDIFAVPKPKVVAAESKSAKITGRIINKKTNKPLTGKDVKIQVDEVNLESAYVDSTKGTYEFVSELGKKFVLNAKLANYYPEFDRIDLTNEKTNVKMVRDLYLTPLEVGQSIKLKNIFFDLGKSILKPESYPELDKLHKFLTDNPDIKVEIGGHTDNVGDAEKNLQLSRWRARAVQQYLIGKGIDIKRINFNGYGKNDPVGDNKTKAGRALNRRVEFKILEN